MTEIQISRKREHNARSLVHDGSISLQAFDLPPPRPRHLGTYEVVSADRQVDRSLRTIAFLDNFDSTGKGSSLGKTNIAHGEISARAAEQNGFNVLRLQLNYKAMRFEKSSDFSLPLKSIYEDMLSGRLHLRSGDVLNISGGQPFIGIMGQPSFSELNELQNFKREFGSHRQ